MTEEEAFIGLIVYSDAAVKRKREAVANLREQMSNVTVNVLAILSEHRWLERAYTAWLYAVDRDVEFGAKSFSWLV